MIDLCIAMLQAIGHYKPFGFMYRVISCGLIKYALRNFNGRSFALYDHNSFSTGIKNDNISSFLKLIQIQAPFYLYQRLRKLFIFYQIVDKMLPYPLFRS